MSEIKDGGPAFPGPDQAEQTVDINEGMTLRDYFAEGALQGICAHVDSWGLGSAQQIADKSYELADAMLRARGAA
jgi:hypothetical protein